MLSLLIAIIGALCGAGLLLMTVWSSKLLQRRQQNRQDTPVIRHIRDLLLPILSDSERMHVEKVLSIQANRAVIIARRDSGVPFVAKIYASKNTPSVLWSASRESFTLAWLAGECSPLLNGVKNSRDGRTMVVETELLKGTTLAAVMRTKPDPRMSEVRDVVDSICEAVIQLHDAGFIHGDLKPSNVICSREFGGRFPTGPVKLIDFESSVPLHEEGRGVGAWTSSVRGTVGFTAPERFWRLVSLPQTDVYSCGAIASYLLTGIPRRPGSKAKQRIDNLKIRDLILRSTSIDPRQRPSSVRKFAEEWRSAFRGISPKLLNATVGRSKSTSVEALVEALEDGTVLHSVRLDDEDFQSSRSRNVGEIVDRWLREVDPDDRRLLGLIGTIGEPEAVLGEETLRRLGRLHRNFERRVIEEVGSPSALSEIGTSGTLENY